MPSFKKRFLSLITEFITCCINLKVYPSKLFPTVRSRTSYSINLSSKTNWCRKSGPLRFGSAKLSTCTMNSSPIRGSNVHLSPRALFCAQRIRSSWMTDWLHYKSTSTPCYWNMSTKISWIIRFFQTFFTPTSRRRSMQIQTRKLEVFKTLAIIWWTLLRFNKDLHPFRIICMKKLKI